MKVVVLMYDDDTMHAHLLATNEMRTAHGLNHLNDILVDWGATEARDVEWRTVSGPYPGTEAVKPTPSPPRRKGPRTIKITHSYEQGIAAGRRNCCMIIACARAMAKDPTDSEAVKLWYEEVARLLPRKPHGRMYKGLTDAGVYYGSAAHALKHLNVKYRVHQFKQSKPTVGQYLGSYPPIERAIISVRRHVGFVAGDHVYDLTLRQRVLTVYEILCGRELTPKDD